MASSELKINIAPKYKTYEETAKAFDGFRQLLEDMSLNVANARRDDLRRVKWVTVSYEILAGLLRPEPRHHDVVFTTTMPKDFKIVKIVDANYSYQDPLARLPYSIRMLIQSNTFDVVPEGTVAPDFTPVYQITYVKENNVIREIDRKVIA